MYKTWKYGYIIYIEINKGIRRVGCWLPTEIHNLGHVGSIPAPASIIK